ncbi:ISKra4 family transposase [Candidatus Poribacteria bacterium]
MTEAAILDLESYRQTALEQKFRECLHRELDKWLSRLGDVMDDKEKPSGLWGITERIRKQREELMGTVAMEWVKKEYASYLDQEHAECPICGKWLKRQALCQRTLETMIGEITIKRPYFYCSVCGHGFYPLDEVLGLSSRRKQYDVQEAATELAKEVPYQKASRLFTKLSGVSMSDHVMHDVVNAAGDDLSVLDVSPTRDEILGRIHEVAQGKKWRPIMVLGIDGADVATRPESAKGSRRGRKKHRAKRVKWKGEWREAKGFRIYLVDGDRIVHLLSWHQIQNEAELAAGLKQVKAAGLIDETLVRLCVIADGMPWIWKRVKELFPTAREILDFYHCSEYIHDVALNQYMYDPLKALEWVEATMARLFCGEADRVIWGLERMKPRDTPSRHVIARCCGYLKKHLDRIDYGSHRKGGYPIGSGGIESAHRFICHARLKRSGAWWYVENSNRMLALRCADYNGTFERVFQKYVQKNQVSRIS